MPTSRHSAKSEETKSEETKSEETKVPEDKPEKTEREKEIEQHPLYCPGCGRLYDYPQRCSGSSEAPHPPIEVVSTDELKSGDPAQHSSPVYV